MALERAKQFAIWRANLQKVTGLPSTAQNGISNDPIIVSSSGFERFRQICLVYKKQFTRFSIPTQLIPPDTIVLNQIEVFAAQVFPEKFTSDFVALKSTSNGNCFYNSASLSLFNCEDYAEEIRCRVVVELATNYELYSRESEFLSKDQISQMVHFSGVDIDRVSFTGTSSDTGVKNAEQTIKYYCMKQTKEFEHASIISFPALANALNVAVESIYPYPDIDPSTSDHPAFHFNVVFQPQNALNSGTVRMMWTGNFHLTCEFKGGRLVIGKDWLPNHFVPVMERAQTLDLSTVTESGAALFICKWCDATFTRKFNLKIHLEKSRCHSREPLFKCTQCSSGFSRKYTLQRHVATIHGPESERPPKLRKTRYHRDYEGFTTVVVTVDDSGGPNSTDAPRIIQIRAEPRIKPMGGSVPVGTGTPKVREVGADTSKESVVVTTDDNGDPIVTGTAESANPGGEETPAKVNSNMRKLSHRIVCYFDGCGETLTRLVNYIGHVNQKHGMNCVIEERSFPDYESFMAWKIGIERNQNVSLVNCRGSSRHRYSTTTTFLCNRSFSYKSRAEGKRAAKRVGSCRTGGHCTSFIIAVVPHETKTVEVRYCLTHVPHDILARRNRLHKDVQEEVIQKLQAGLTKREIVESMNRAAENADEACRDYSITLKDVQNIKQKLPLALAVARRANNRDYTGIDELVRKMALQVYNPVFLFEKQGILDEETGEEVASFAMGTIFQSQINVFKMYGGNCVCLDSSHKVSDLLLTTVVVLDEGGRGHPVAFLLTDCEHEMLYRLFFEKLRKKVGEIRTEEFVSELDDSAWNAWEKVFDARNTERRVSSWHVEKAWQLKLKDNGRVSSGVLCTLFCLLRSLLRLKDKGDFLRCFKTFSNFVEKRNKLFATYFSENFAPRANEWAGFSTTHLQGRINIFLESYHRVLRYVFEEGEKKVEAVLRVLEDYASDSDFREYLVYRSIQSESVVAETNNRHRDSEQIPDDEVEIVSENEWRIKDLDTGAYARVISHSDELCDCVEKCEACGACKDNFTCDCEDFYTQRLACKHVHKVCPELPYDVRSSHVEEVRELEGQSERVENRDKLADKLESSKFYVESIKDIMAPLVESLDQRTYEPAVLREMYDLLLAVKRVTEK